MITYNEFIKKYLGKTYDYDGYAGCQCIDTAKMYMNKCLGLYPKAYGNAKDYWLNREKYNFFVNNFDFIKIDSSKPYSKTKLKAGDIGVRTSGIYGHIFIVDNNTEKTLKYYDTNGKGNNDPLTEHVVPYTTQFITGVLRPKSIKRIVTAKSGLNYYNHISDTKPAGILPYGFKTDVVIDNAGEKKIGGTTYKMSIFRYKGKQYYCAKAFLR